MEHKANFPVAVASKMVRANGEFEEWCGYRVLFLREQLALAFMGGRVTHGLRIWLTALAG